MSSQPYEGEFCFFNDKIVSNQLLQLEILCTCIYTCTVRVKQIPINGPFSGLPLYENRARTSRKRGVHYL